MGTINRSYGPPETDSEDEYDGFYFGDDHVKKTRVSNFVESSDDELYDAVSLGDLDRLKREVDSKNFNVNSPIKGQLSLLYYACRGGYLDVVYYLLEDKNADANKNIDSFTPLMYACECTTAAEETVEKIVLMLLRHGAVINVSDKFGTTPFMIACKNGHVAAVRHMIKDVSFDAVDNYGCTPIFHAIENNQVEIVKILIDAGVNTAIPNRKGYIPRQVAQFHGFYDLLELLPKEKEVYVVPSQYLSYNTLRDYIPRIFLKSDCPEYFQEINAILMSINMEKFLEYFAKGKVSLSEFLAIDDKRLEEIGIVFPIYRMRIRKVLLDFHLHNWSMKSIAQVQKSSNENFYNILMITANHLQHLVIITSTLRFLKQNLQRKELGRIRMTELQDMKLTLNKYRDVLKDLNKTVKYLSSFSPPKNPIYIDYDEFVEDRKRHKLKKYFRYTTLLLGVSFFICLKVKKYFF